MAGMDQDVIARGAGFEHHSEAGARRLVVGVPEIKAGRGTLGWHGTADVTLAMSLHVLDRLPARVQSVQLAGLSLTLKDASVQADGGPAAVEVSGVPAGQSSFDVRPDTPRRVQVRLHEIREADEYKAAIRLDLADADPIDQNITFYVREDGWMAVGFIVAGVLVSTAVAFYTRQIRRRLQQQRAVLRLMADGAVRSGRWKPLGSEERIVFGAITTLLDNLWRKATLRDGVIGDALVQDPAVAPPDLTSEISGLNEKLLIFSAWVAARRRVMQPDGEPLQKYRPVLDTAASYLCNLAGPEVTFESQRIALGSLQFELDRQAKTPPPRAEAAAAVPQLSVAHPGTVGRVLHRLTARRDRFDDLVLACFLVVGVLLGWKLFWVDNLTWGGWSDRVKCLLWGFGLHQVTDATVIAGGLQGIRDRFRSSDASA